MGVILGKLTVTGARAELLEAAYSTWMAEGNSFQSIYPLFPEQKPASVRRMIYKYRDMLGEGLKRLPPVPFYDDEIQRDEIDEAEVWQRAVAVSERKLAKAGRHASATFDYGPVCIVHMADWHLGAEGTDYARLEEELSLIAETPGMYVGFVGDALDNFIVAKLMHVRMHTPFRVTEEWALVRYALDIIAPKLLYAVGGNHDAWTIAAAGVDYLADTIRRYTAAPYDADDLTLDVAVGDASYTIRARHKWRLSSMFNPTHGIEQASRFDKGRRFDVGVGAHTHASGLCREFNNGGQTGLAVLCGAYKRYDDFATRVGFAAPNDGTAVATVLSEDGMWGTSNLRLAANYMKALYEDGADA